MQFSNMHLFAVFYHINDHKVMIVTKKSYLSHSYLTADDLPLGWIRKEFINLLIGSQLITFVSSNEYCRNAYLNELMKKYIENM